MHFEYKFFFRYMLFMVLYNLMFLTPFSVICFLAGFLVFFCLFELENLKKQFKRKH